MVLIRHTYANVKSTGFKHIQLSHTATSISVYAFFLVTRFKWFLDNLSWCYRWENTWWYPTAPSSTMWGRFPQGTQYRDGWANNHHNTPAKLDTDWDIWWTSFSGILYLWWYDIRFSLNIFIWLYDLLQLICWYKYDSMTNC